MGSSSNSFEPSTSVVTINLQAHSTRWRPSTASAWAANRNDKFRRFPVARGVFLFTAGDRAAAVRVQRARCEAEYRDELIQGNFFLVVEEVFDVVVLPKLRFVELVVEDDSLSLSPTRSFFKKSQRGTRNSRTSLGEILLPLDCRWSLERLHILRVLRHWLKSLLVVGRDWQRPRSSRTGRDASGG